MNEADLTEKPLLHGLPYPRSGNVLVTLQVVHEVRRTESSGPHDYGKNIAWKLRLHEPLMEG